MEYIYGTIFQKKNPINVSYAHYKKRIQKLYKKEPHNIYNFLKLKTNSDSNPCYITAETCAYIILIIKYLSVMSFLVDIFSCVFQNWNIFVVLGVS